MAEVAQLNTGASIPLLGLGTLSIGSFSHEEKKAAIAAAIEVGYRHFDTASSYKSEGILGEALQGAIKAGVVKREDLFITSKLWCSDAYPEGVLPALQKSLRELQLEYLDLYLIHWPIRCKGGFPKLDELLPFDVKGTWKAMEDCAKQGLTRAIGVSNFSSKKIMDLLEFADIPPAVNQIVLRWGLDQGVSVLPKSFNKKRMAENLDVFGWHLTDEDHHNISKIEQKKSFDGSFICNPVSGPYKSITELWDGEI